MKFSVFQISRQGGRAKNEDRMGYSYTHETALFALADGMGGHPDGELAAELALQTLAAQFQREAHPLLASPADFLLNACRVAHHHIIRYGTGRRLEDTPRTTVVACVLQHGCAWWAHCGDSRLYLVRARREVLRTRDHSYAEQSRVFPALGASEQYRGNRNVLFTCLGSPSLPIVDVAGPMALQPRDRLLLCSDGLWSELPGQELVARLGEHSQPMSAVIPALVERALAAGGSHADNVTALGVEWEPAAEDDAVDSRVLTDSLAPDAFASIQPPPTDPDDPDDAAIERAVAEINAALRRTGERR